MLQSIEGFFEKKHLPKPFNSYSKVMSFAVIHPIDSVTHYYIVRNLSYSGLVGAIASVHPGMGAQRGRSQ